jgi:myo-inositol 2-dehydrogenase/D-chiro-inositol 1-dehydrogenase
MTKEGIVHDTVPDFMDRFQGAYLVQIQDFVNNVLCEKKPSVTGKDGLAALIVCLAATKSFKENRPVDINEIAESS